MSTTKLEMNALTIEVNALAGGNCHSLRECVLKGLQAQPAKNLLDNTTTQIAPHVHELYARIEKQVRSDEKMKDMSEVEIFKECIETVKGLLKEERLFLVKNYDWDSNNMPYAFDQAHRKIVGAWETGGSLMHLTTVSQCEKHTRDVRSEARKAKAKGAASVANGDASSDESIHGLPELKLPDRTTKAIAALIKAAGEAGSLNDGNTADIIMAAVRRCDEMVAKILSDTAEKVIQDKDAA